MSGLIFFSLLLLLLVSQVFFPGATELLSNATNNNELSQNRLAVDMSPCSHIYPRIQAEAHIRYVNFLSSPILDLIFDAVKKKWR